MIVDVGVEFVKRPPIARIVSVDPSCAGNVVKSVLDSCDLEEASDIVRLTCIPRGGPPFPGWFDQNAGVFNFDNEIHPLAPGKNWSVFRTTCLLERL